MKKDTPHILRQEKRGGRHQNVLNRPPLYIWDQESYAQGGGGGKPLLRTHSSRSPKYLNDLKTRLLLV